MIIQSAVPGVVRCPRRHQRQLRRLRRGQISPVNSVVSDPDRGSVLADGMADALKQQAISKGTYYATCPARPSGEVVWVESGNCPYQGNMQVNGTTKRGVFIINNGTLKLRGGVQWWGLIYALNAQGCGSVSRLPRPAAAPTAWSRSPARRRSPAASSSRAPAGSARATAAATATAQNCEPQTRVRPERRGSNITAYGTAGIIQNTWRELLRQ